MTRLDIIAEIVKREATARVLETDRPLSEIPTECEVIRWELGEIDPDNLRSDQIRILRHYAQSCLAAHLWAGLGGTSSVNQVDPLGEPDGEQYTQGTETSNVIGRDDPSAGVGAPFYGDIPTDAGEPTVELPGRFDRWGWEKSGIDVTITPPPPPVAQAKS